MINTLTTITLPFLSSKRRISLTAMLSMPIIIFLKICSEMTLTRSTYFSVYREDCTNEWFLVYGDDYKVQDIIVDSKAGRILSGVSFWDAPTAERLSALSTRLMQVASLLISTGTIWLRITSKS